MKQPEMTNEERIQNRMEKIKNEFESHQNSKETTLNGDTYIETWNRLSKFERDKIIGTAILANDAMERRPTEDGKIRTLVITLVAFYTISGGKFNGGESE